MSLFHIGSDLFDQIRAQEPRHHNGTDASQEVLRANSRSGRHFELVLHFSSAEQTAHRRFFVNAFDRSRQQSGDRFHADLRFRFGFIAQRNRV